jgi:hypothetical protein
MVLFRNRWLIALAAIAVALVPVIADAHARAGGGCCSGTDFSVAWRALPRSRSAIASHAGRDRRSADLAW